MPPFVDITTISKRVSMRFSALRDADRARHDRRQLLQPTTSRSYMSPEAAAARYHGAHHDRR